MVWNPQYRLQSDEERNKYLNQLYGGSPPSMDYYRQLGEQARARREAMKEAERQAREAERQREKEAEQRALDELMKEIAQTNRQASTSVTKEKDRKGFFETLAGLGEAVGTGFKEAGRFIKEGGLNPFSERGKQAQRDLYQRGEKYSKEHEGMKDLLNLTHSAVDAASFGALGSDEYQRGGALGLIGQLGGSLVPGSLIASHLRGTRLGANLSKNMTHGQRAAQRAKEGIAAGAIYGVADAGATELLEPDKYTLPEHLKNIALETAFGAVADPAIGRLLDALPTPRVVSSVRDVVGREAAQQATETPLGLPPPQLRLEEPPLGLPAPQRRLEPPALELPRPLDPYDPLELPQARERYFDNVTRQSSSERLSALEDMVQLEETRRQAEQVEELLNVRRAEHDSRLTEEIESVRTQQAELQREYEQMRQAFIDKGVEPLEKEVSDALSQWESVKQLRQEYARLRQLLGGTRGKKHGGFRIPELYKEEYSKLVPRNFINPRAGRDIFDAASEAGFTSDHDGALELANLLRNGVEANKIRMKDLVPDLKEQKAEIESLRATRGQEFAQSEEAQALQRVIDAYDMQIEQLRGQTFTSTEEYQATQDLIKALQDEISNIRARIANISQRPTNPLAELGLLQPGNTARFEPPPQPYTGANPYQPQGVRPALRVVRQQPQAPEVPAAATVEPMPGGGGTVPPDVPPRTDEPMGTPDDADMLTFDRGDGGIPENTNMSTLDRMIQRTTDDLHGIKITEKIAGTESNMYRNARLTRGAGGASEVYIRRTLEPAILELQQAGKLTEGNQYILDKHLLRVKELNPNYKIPGGKSVEGMQANVAKWENDPDIQKFADAVRNYQRGILDLLEQAQVISPKTKKDLIETYPDYVPLFRSLQKKSERITLDDIFESYEKISRGNVRKAIMELSEYGSENVVNRPIDNLVQYGINAHHAAFSNKAMRELKKLDGITIDGKLVAHKIAPKTEKKYPKENIVTFFENGQAVKYYVNDDILRSLESLKGIVQFDEVANFFHGVAKIQRQSITANPLFSIKQILRDIPQAWTVGNFSLVRDLIPAFMDMITKGQRKNSMLDKFFEHGAGMSNLVSFDRSSFLALQRASKQLKQRGVVEAGKDEVGHIIRTAFDKMRQFNEALENAPKLAQFRATARRTGDFDQAAFDARDIMDFARSGEATRTINRYAAFINATIQGRSKQFREMNRPETWLKMAIVGAFPSVLAYQALNSEWSWASETQRRIINESPEWQRQTYWLVPSPFDENNVIRIPKPYEVAMLVSTPLEFILQNEDKVGTEPKEALIEWLNQAIWVDPSLNPLTPLYELGTGVDTFTGQPIIPRAEQGLPASEQYDVRTNPIARGVSALTGGLVSPRIAEHAIEGYFPMISETTGDIIGGIMDRTGMSENPAPTGTRRVPLIDDLRIRGENYLANTLVGQAHDTQQEVQQMKSQMQQGGELFPYSNAYRAIREVQQRDSELAAQIRAVDNDPNLSADEKRQRRIALLQERNQNVRLAQEAGMYDTSEENLARMEGQFQELEAAPTRDDYLTVLQGQLVKAGIPEVDAQAIINQAREADLSTLEIAELIRDFLRNM